MNVIVETKLASEAGTSFKEPVSLVPDLNKFILDILETH